MYMIIIAAGIGVMLIGLLFHNRHQALKRVCTLQVAGTIVRLERKEATHTETDDDGYTTTRKTVAYHPVFRYTVKDREYVKTASAGSGRPKFTEGQAVTVMVDPENPDRSYFTQDKDGSRFGIYMMIFGAVVLIIGIVASFTGLTVSN